MMLSADAVANTYSLHMGTQHRSYSGWNSAARTPFLWCVRIEVASPVSKSHVRTVASALPVTTCGSPACVATQWTVPRCPPSTIASAFVRMSHTRQTLSLPPVRMRSRVGCVAMQYTPLRCPWYERTTLLHSRSQHFTDLSSPHENRYGERAEIATPRTVWEWPVRVSFRFPDARSQIYRSARTTEVTLMVRSALPVANHSLLMSIATHRTQPK